MSLNTKFSLNTNILDLSYDLTSVVEYRNVFDLVFILSILYHIRVIDIQKVATRQQESKCH